MCNFMGRKSFFLEFPNSFNSSYISTHQAKSFLLYIYYVKSVNLNTVTAQIERRRSIKIYDFFACSQWSFYDTFRLNYSILGQMMSNTHQSVPSMCLMVSSQEWCSICVDTAIKIRNNLPGSVGESNPFGCCGFSCADLRCKFKLHLIEGGWN